MVRRVAYVCSVWHSTHITYRFAHCAIDGVQSGKTWLVLPDDACTQNSHRCGCRLLPCHSLAYLARTLQREHVAYQGLYQTSLLAYDEVGDILDLKHSTGEQWPLERITNEATELVNEDN